MKKIFLVLITAFAFSGCEKDDICDGNTPTTPRLVIECYEFGAITPTIKAVTKLKAVATTESEGVIFNTATDATKYLLNGTKILLPLKINDNLNTETVVYNLTLNFGDTNANSDFLTIKYVQNKVYISRACGYKTLFNLDATAPVTVAEPSTPDGAWIKAIQIVKPNLETENETHVKIYF